MLALWTDLFRVRVTLTRKDQRRQWQPTPVLLPGKSHGQRSLVGCSPWGRKESDMTEWLTFTFHFHALKKEMATHSSVLAWRIPGMGGTWWAAVYGVAQSRTQVKRLSSSSSSSSVSDKMILQPLYSKYGPWNSSMGTAESMWETQLRAPDQTYWLTGPDEGKWSDVRKALALGAKKVIEKCYFNAIFF